MGGQSSNSLNFRLLLSPSVSWRLQAYSVQCFLFLMFLDGLRQIQKSLSNWKFGIFYFVSRIFVCQTVLYHKFSKMNFIFFFRVWHSLRAMVTWVPPQIQFMVRWCIGRLGLFFTGPGSFPWGQWRRVERANTSIIACITQINNSLQVNNIENNLIIFRKVIFFWRKATFYGECQRWFTHLLLIY